MKKNMYVNHLKKWLDLLCAIVLLIILSPLLLIISLVIKSTSKGPVLFVQDRIGKGQNIYHIYKFRTMVTDAELVGDGLFVFSESDARITSVGKLLRKTSLDELPQLINIIKGDMSFIGPRPPVIYHPYKVNEYPTDFLERFAVLPGITGLAQVELRNSAVWNERIKLDIEYVEKVSFVFDLSILLKTVITVFKRENIVISEEHKKQIEKRENSDLE